MAKMAEGGMDRREFLGAAAILIGGAALAAGCGDDAAGSGDGGKPGTVEPAGSPGHDHDVLITAAQLEAGAAVTLTLTGNGHTHTVDLSAAEVSGLKAGTAHLTKTSTDTGSHTHLVHFF